MKMWLDSEYILKESLKDLWKDLVAWGELDSQVVQLDKTWGH